jgi:hypothetical protein
MQAFGGRHSAGERPWPLGAGHVDAAVDSWWMGGERLWM